MNRVTNLSEYRAQREPHKEGTAICANCGHEWVAIAPLGVMELECPECRCMKGYFVHPCEKEAKHWTCNCGSILFSITPDGVYCPNCGLDQEGFV